MRGGKYQGYNNIEVRSKEQETTSMSQQSSSLPSLKQPKKDNRKTVRQQIMQEVLSSTSMSPRTFLNEGKTINQSSGVEMGSAEF